MKPALRALTALDVTAMMLPSGVNQAPGPPLVRITSASLPSRAFATTARGRFFAKNAKASLVYIAKERSAPWLWRW
jgi:hypothetical protein